MERTLAAILAADVSGYSRLMEADEVLTLSRMKALLSNIVRPTIQKRHGRIFKVMGDGLLAQFSSVVDAVECSLEIQRALLTFEPDVDDGDKIRLRIGINLGDVMIDGGDVYGDGVNIAARLEQLAPVGGIAISGGAHDQICGKLDAAFEDRGEQAVKNLSRPVRVWSWGGPQSAAAAPAAPGKAPANLSGKAGFGPSSLAVLPFANLSDDRAFGFLADGLSEDVTTLLARLPGIFVIARNSSFAFKDKTVDVRDIGRELGVTYIVEGSLRPVGDKARVTVQLIEAATGNHLWVKRFEQPASRIYELQDEITLGIAASLVPELARVELDRIDRRDPIDLGAWDLYKKAAGLLSIKGWHRETFAEAITLLKRAVLVDPKFALAHAYLSLIYAIGHMFGFVSDDVGGPKQAIAAAEAAMRIDNQSADVLGLAGCALADVGQIGRGIDILERAIESDPSNPQAWVALGAALLRSGKARKGIEMLRHGMHLSPLDNRLSFWGANLAYALFRFGEHDDAETEARMACRRDPNNYMSRVILALILLRRDRPAEARDCVDEALRLRPGLQRADMRAMIGRRGIQLLQNAKFLD